MKRNHHPWAPGVAPHVRPPSHMCSQHEQAKVLHILYNIEGRFFIRACSYHRPQATTNNTHTHTHRHKKESGQHPPVLSRTISRYSFVSLFPAPSRRFLHFRARKWEMDACRVYGVCRSMRTSTHPGWVYKQRRYLSTRPATGKKGRLHAFLPIIKYSPFSCAAAGQRECVYVILLFCVHFSSTIFPGGGTRAVENV